MEEMEDAVTVLVVSDGDDSLPSRAMHLLLLQTQPAAVGPTE
jgi:hypothetical protein